MNILTRVGDAINSVHIPIGIALRSASHNANAVKDFSEILRESASGQGFLLKYYRRKPIKSGSK